MFAAIIHNTNNKLLLTNNNISLLSDKYL